MRLRWYAPLDDTCPEVQEQRESFFNDPMTRACGCADEIWEAWARRHFKNCKRCQEFGAANIEARDD